MASTTSSDVLELIDLLDEAGIVHWIAGGWGIDALVGHETRPHRDLDALVPFRRVLDVHRLLLAHGYQIEADGFPTRFEMIHESGCRVEVHPVRLDERGGGRLEMADGTWWISTKDALSARGAIGGRSVTCVSVSQQVTNHTGYEPTEKDRADMAVLAKAFSIRVPSGYALNDLASRNTGNHRPMSS